MEKRCPKCKLILDIQNFNRDRSTKDGLYPWCKSCVKRKDAVNYRSNKETKLLRNKQYDRDNPEKKTARNKRYAASNSKKRREQGIKYRHGITTEQYNELLRIQNNCCAICGKDFALITNIKNIHLDHDHKTGAIRSILCGKCNVALGHVDDNIGVLYKMISYLVAHSLVMEGGVSRLG